MNYNSEAEQDKFVLSVLKFMPHGYFLEIGSNEPIFHNNTYLLESKYDWKGIMVESNQSFLPLYKQHRPNSIHIIGDAATVDYKKVLEADDAPLIIGYLQIDLEVSNGSTLRTLQLLDETVMDKYTFAIVTFEHDIYASNYGDTRMKSRGIFEKRGYYRVFEDISNFHNPYEDWYVHPSLVDMEYIRNLQRVNAGNYKESKIPNIQSLEFNDINYGALALPITPGLSQ